MGPPPEFEIRLVLIGGALGHFGDERAAVDRSELVEGGEEVIVPGFFARDEVAHGKAVDQGIAEVVVGLGGGGRSLAGGARSARARGGESQGGLDHAQVLIDRGAQETLGIDGAGDVIVKVGAFRHPVEKSVEFEGALAEFGEALIHSAPRCGWRRRLRAVSHG